MSTKPKPRKLYRNASTGRFMSKAYVKRFPEKTVTETAGKRKKGCKR